MRGITLSGASTEPTNRACPTRMRRLRSPVLYINQTLVPRITQGAHPTNVVLLFGEARLERRPLSGLQRVIEGTVGHCDRFVQAQHFGHVHGFARVVLLVVALSHRSE